MILRLGSNNDNVKKLQTELGAEPDGDFGPNTEKLVKAWQTRNGLTPDGIFDDDSWIKMFGSKPVVTLNLEALIGHIPDTVIKQLPDTIKKFDITTNLRLAHFLSQCYHESGGFKVVSENLNYSADGLKKTFGKYFPGNMADLYAKNPEKIASRVYASRMGNGVESTKEGFKFKGSGYIQLTGKENFKNFSDFIGEDCVANPKLVSEKYPLASAAFFFKSNNLWKICDKGSDIKTITELSKRINGGVIGLDKRIEEFNKIYNLVK